MGLHKRAESLYPPFSLALAKEEKQPDNSRISKAFQKVIEWLHRTKKTRLKPEDLKTPAMRRLVNETTAVFSEAVDYALQERNPSKQLTYALKRSAYVFSGFKDYHLAREASELLIDKNGGIKPFNQFLNDVKQLDDTYNKNYLHTEYKFAVASAQSAEKWEQFTKDGDRYNLQYRTANDKRVRETHKELHGTTLPIDSKFWDDYFPPNGFGCRCTVVQVRKSKYPLSNEADAIQKGKEATQGSHEKMMRFNPGKQHSLFPAHNPYTISKCTGCSRSGFKLAKIPTNEQCAVCGEILKIADERAQRAEIKKWAKNNLKGEIIRHRNLDKDINITNTCIDEFLNQPHKHYAAKNTLLKDIVNVVKKAEYKGYSSYHKNNPKIKYSHIFEITIHGDKSWIIAREELGSGITNLYSISDNEKVLTEIKKK